MVNMFYLKQTLDKTQKQAVTLGLNLEPENVPFL